MSRLPFVLTTTKSCNEQWSAMTGSPSGRHCHTCNKSIRDLTTLTACEIEHLIHQTAGRSFCARVTRKPDGSVATMPDPSPSPGFGSALVLAATLSASSSAFSQRAIVTGSVTNPKSNVGSGDASVIFIQSGASVLETKTDINGNFRAELTPGTYDVVFRSSVMFGERVTNIQFHEGEQSFSPVHSRFDYGHLGVIDSSNEVTVTVGEVVSVVTGMSFHYAVRHPISYLAMMKRRLAHALTA